MSNMYMNSSDHDSKKRIEIKSYEYIKRQFQTNKEKSSSDGQHENIKQAIARRQKELTALKKQKELLLKDVQKSINNEKYNWDIEKQQLIKQAHKEGHEAGFGLGEQKSLEQYAQSIKQANDIVQSATKDYHETIEKSENKMIELATHIAGKIIKREIEQDENIMAQIVKAVIKDIKEQPSIAIYAHPNYYHLLVQQKKELQLAVDGDCEISIYVDPDLSTQDCRIEHPFGQVDAGVNTQLKQIHDVLQGIVMERQP